MQLVSSSRSLLHDFCTIANVPVIEGDREFVVAVTRVGCSFWQVLLSFLRYRCAHWMLESCFEVDRVFAPLAFDLKESLSKVCARL